MHERGEDSLRRYVQFASESCIQELLAASDTNRGKDSDGWKILTLDNGVEISKRRSGSLHTFRSRWILRSVSPQQFITVANAIDAAKLDPAGWLPKCFVNRFNTKLVMIIEDLKKLAQACPSEAEI
ncbi:hypothetical protein V8G54_016922 [Vigna mungo]|uniref:START domain-containing protein n=1 Tax=Vigna mungo TaxID=3915 RepID=A0AAQ3RZT3_VIGMU